MNVKQKNKEKGFTIIEVVLVLAIAGLIFLMVFIALPALQRGQRDGQRRSDLARAQTKLQDYQTNNRNKLPAAGDWNTTFVTQYLRAGGDSFDDPSRGPYTLQVSESNPTFDTSTAVIYVSPTKTCDGENLADAGSQKVALRIKLEGGGVACVNN
jgi:prepilin-type N-terminal cleavage/methylation domain-containing protein